MYSLDTRDMFPEPMQSLPNAPAVKDTDLAYFVFSSGWPPFALLARP